MNFRKTFIRSTAFCLASGLLYAVSLRPEHSAVRADAETSHRPLLKKGTKEPKGGFALLAEANSDASKSLSIPGFQRGKMIQISEPINAQSLCVTLISDANQRRLSVTSGGTMWLRFRHSIYGAEVEELFLLRRDGFELFELRYGEARMAEFYGHESSRHENGRWVVRPAPSIVKFLHLHPSSEAMMSLHFDSLDERPAIQSDTAYRLFVGSCDNVSNG